MMLDPELRNRIATDLLVRKENGIREYGSPLSITSNNPALKDAYEEALDCLLYVRQAIEKKHFEQHSKPIVDLVIADTLVCSDLENIYQTILEVVCRLAMLKNHKTDEQI